MNFSPDPLQRFLDAQASTYEQAHTELAAGQKRTHWMWFVFPQIRGLGSSAMAQHYAIAGLAEAGAYLAHSVLGPRLRTCTSLVNDTPNPSVDHIFGFPDNLKFHSSITLFAEAAKSSPSPGDRIFDQALQQFFAGKPDPATLDRLKV